MRDPSASKSKRLDIISRRAKTRKKYTSSKQKEHAARKRKQALTKNLKLIFERHRRKPVGRKKKKKQKTLEELLEKYNGREDELYQRVCKKYGIDPNPTLLPRRKPKTTSTKRGVKFSWASRREVIEEVVLTYQYAMEVRVKGFKDDPLACDRITQIIFEFTGSIEKGMRAHQRTSSHDNRTATLFLDRPSEEELDSIWEHTAPNGSVNENEFLVLVKNLVTLSRNQVLKQISRQREATRHYRKQNTPQVDAPGTPRGGDLSDRSNGDRFSDLWEAENESISIAAGGTSSDCTTLSSTSSSFQKLFFSLADEEKALKSQYRDMEKVSDHKSLSEISQEAPAVGDINLAVQAGQIAVRCNRILGAMMEDRQRFLDHFKGIAKTITRSNFYDILHHTLPILSYELAIIQKHKPRRRASQGEGLKWQPPVAKLEMGDVPVHIHFEFSDVLIMELREQKRLNSTSPSLSPHMTPVEAAELPLIGRPRSGSLPMSPFTYIPSPLTKVVSAGTISPFCLESPTKEATFHLTRRASDPTCYSRSPKPSIDLTNESTSEEDAIIAEGLRSVSFTPLSKRSDSDPIAPSFSSKEKGILQKRLNSISQLPALPPIPLPKTVVHMIAEPQRSSSFEDEQFVHPLYNTLLSVVKGLYSFSNVHLDSICNVIIDFLPNLELRAVEPTSTVINSEVLDCTTPSSMSLIDQTVLLPITEFQFDPVTLHIAPESNVRQVLEYIFSFCRGLEDCQKRLKLLLVRNGSMSTLDVESRYILQSEDNLTLMERFDI